MCHHSSSTGTADQLVWIITTLQGFIESEGTLGKEAEDKCSVLILLLPSYFLLLLSSGQIHLEVRDVNITGCWCNHVGQCPSTVKRVEKAGERSKGANRWCRVHRAKYFKIKSIELILFFLACFQWSMNIKEM